MLMAAFTLRSATKPHAQQQEVAGATRNRTLKDMHACASLGRPLRTGHGPAVSHPLRNERG